MAREFKTTEGIMRHFHRQHRCLPSKTSLVLSLVQQLYVAALDISNAFLMVDQQELVIIAIPEWVKSALKQPDLEYWRQARCLPGQRNAAWRWCEFFGNIWSEIGYESLSGGMLYGRKDKESDLSVHVGDALFIVSKEDIQEFCDHMKSKNLTLKVEGPLGGEESGILHYLARERD